MCKKIVKSLFLTAYLFLAGIKLYSQNTPEFRFQGGHTTDIRKILFTDDSRYIVSLEVGVTKIWDINTGRLVQDFYSFTNRKQFDQNINRSFFPERALKAIVYHNNYFNKNLFVIVIEKGDSIAWDFNTGELLSEEDQLQIRRGNWLSGYISQTDSTDLSSIISSDQNWKATLLHDNHIQIKAKTSGRITRVISGYSQGISNLIILQNPLQLLVSNENGKTKVWNFQSGQISFFEQLLSPEAVLSPNKKFIFSGLKNHSQDSVNSIFESGIWDVENLKFIKKSRTLNYPIFSAAISPDNTTLLTLKRFEKAELARLSDGKILDSLSNLEYGIDEIFFMPDNSPIAIETGGKIINVKTKQVFNEIKDDKLMFFNPVISPDGKQLLVANTNYFSPRLYNLFTGKSVKEFSSHTDYIYEVAFSPNAKYIASGGKDKIVKIHETETGALIKDLVGHGKLITNLVFSPDNSFLASSDDTAVKIWKIPTGELLVTFIPSSESNSGWVAFTPDGFYMGEKEFVGKAVHFFKKNKVYLFDQFDLQYNRPDIVLERIGKASKELIESYKRAYEKRLKKMGFNPNNFEKERSFNVPELKVSNFQYFTSVTKPEYQIGFIAEDKLYKLDRINLFVNGVPVFGTRGLDVSKENTQKLTKTLSVTLAQGNNVIEVTALNEKGVESLKERFEVEYKPAKATKPTLYLVNIGVSEYSNPKMNLTYATKDAQDIAQAFAGKTDLFVKIIPIILTDKEVTVENIRKIKETLLKTSVDDRVLVSFSGHGLVDSKLDYYLATHTVNFGNPAENGLAYEELENLLDGIPARQKVLLMDACHSGEIDKEDMIASTMQPTSAGEIKFRNPGDRTVQKKNIGLTNSFELMQELFTDLRRSSGATSISAAGGAEYALESKEWSNGVFTYCLLSGLKERKADLNKDGKIMLSELKEYVQKEVERLTEGRQKPTSRIENLENDWQLW